MQVQVEELFNAGMLPSMTVAEPGAQGATVAGIHGMGVRTPRAAAVAAATVGLAMDMHMPKVGMFTIGLLSMILAAGAPTFVRLSGRTVSALGAAPKLHIIIEPVVTKIGIADLGLFRWKTEPPLVGKIKKFFWRPASAWRS